ncbi:MAG: hypothetical protein ABJD68_10025 [Nakamurella sp.]
MNIDWASLGLVAITTVIAAIAVVGLFSVGVVALTSGGPTGSTDGTVAQPNSMAKLAGYACVGISGLLVLYGLYLIIPQFH